MINPELSAAVYTPSWWASFSICTQKVQQAQSGLLKVAGGRGCQLSILCKPSHQWRSGLKSLSCMGVRVFHNDDDNDYDDKDTTLYCFQTEADVQHRILDHPDWISLSKVRLASFGGQPRQQGNGPFLPLAIASSMAWKGNNWTQMKSVNQNAASIL